VVALARQFRAQPLVAINKADLAPDLADAIAAYAQGEGIPVLARIPYDEKVVEALVAQRPLVEHDGGPAARAIRTLWGQFLDTVGIRVAPAPTQPPGEPVRDEFAPGTDENTLAGR
jgi:MinD superfamily P-loop ATPase